MVTDEEFSPDFIEAVTAGGVPSWWAVMVADPLHACQLAKVLINEAGPFRQGWLLSPNQPTLLPGFVVGRGVKLVEKERKP